MYWAKTALGKLVYAPEQPFPIPGLSCPKCGAPVNLRKGSNRRPHFAHQSHRASPDCEDYYPSAEALRLHGSLVNRNKIALSPRPGSLRFGLFLTHQPAIDHFGLWLRVPPLHPSITFTGSLEIASGTGHKIFDASRLTKPQSVKLALTRMPLAECIGTGDLVELSRHLSDQIGSFGEALNLFLQTEAGGRYLFPGEPVEWGANYWIISKETLKLPVDLLSLIGWKLCGSLNKWHVYEVFLPIRTSSVHQKMEGVLSHFLGRSIKPTRPRAYLVDPYPHHIAEDGAYIYPQLPACLFVRRTSNDEVKIDSYTQLPESVLVSELSEEWVKITGLSEAASEAIVLIGNVEQAILRVEDCDLHRPPGLQASADGRLWDLTDEPPLSSKELLYLEVSIDCVNPRLAEHFEKLNKEWNREGSTLSLPRDIKKTFNAGAFGRLLHRCDTQPPALEDKTFVQHHQQRSAKSTWLTGLVAARYGQYALALLQNYFTNPSYAALSRLGTALPPELMPYVMTEGNFDQ